jgi:hypothetical protein
MPRNLLPMRVKTMMIVVAIKTSSRIILLKVMTTAAAM